MLLVISPAKKLNFESPVATDKFTQPDFTAQAAELIDVLKTYSPAQVGSLMKISDQLAFLNASRYAAWTAKPGRELTRQAVLAFNGDVYEGLNAASLNQSQLDYLQEHLRILSGLYGILRPLDLMQPYRLEMGTRLTTGKGKDLYAFWGTRITEALNAVLKPQKTKVLVNLASEEYFKSVRADKVDAPIITPVFEDWHGGKFKVMSFSAKRARGMMVRFAALNAVASPEQLQDFNDGGYAYDRQASTDTTWVFRRRAAA